MEKMNWEETINEIPPEWRPITEFLIKSSLSEYKNALKEKMELELKRLDDLPVFPKCSRDDYYFRAKRETIEELITYLN